MTQSTVAGLLFGSSAIDVFLHESAVKEADPATVGASENDDVAKQ